MGLNWLDGKPFTTLFVDGNHESFDMLNQLPVAEWNGGKVHHISKSVIHLMRGQVFMLEGKKIFTFGGARSHDIEDGIIKPDLGGNWKNEVKKLRKDCKTRFRIEHISWWKEEMPNSEEMLEGIHNLDANDWTVDFIITHCAPSSVSTLLSLGQYKQDDITNYLEEIRVKTEYRRWFFGHYHKDTSVNYMDIGIYETITRIN